MKISEIYVYPIKSLRGTSVSAAIATKYGFEYDRRFMLLKSGPEGYENMAVAHQNEMVFFLTSLGPSDDEESTGSVVVDYKGPANVERKTLAIPLRPDIGNLEKVEIEMHNSPTFAYKMPEQYNTWFSTCFGYDVVLAYLGDNLRDVQFEDMKPASNGWLSSLSKAIMQVSSADLPAPKITFADCAPYLVVSKTSLENVSARLAEGHEMDVTKFRPNIVVEGAENAWEEDFWAQIKLGPVELACQHNCVRCRSINIDYETGQQGTGESGEVLKKLQKDRRVDAGAKWSPVFGRYSYWTSKHDREQLKVGDEVEIVKRNPERTVWSWKGLS